MRVARAWSSTPHRMTGTSTAGCGAATWPSSAGSSARLPARWESPRARAARGASVRGPQGRRRCAAIRRRDRAPNLTPEQREQVPALLAQRSGPLGGHGDVWTTKRVVPWLRAPSTSTTTRPMSAGCCRRTPVPRRAPCRERGTGVDASAPRLTARPARRRRAGRAAPYRDRGCLDGTRSGPAQRTAPSARSAGRCTPR